MQEAESDEENLKPLDLAVAPVMQRRQEEGNTSTPPRETTMPVLAHLYGAQEELLLSPRCQCRRPCLDVFG